jgi:hypothetical protein
MSGSSFIPHPWGLIIILQELLQSLPFIQAVRILALNDMHFDRLLDALL